MNATASTIHTISAIIAAVASGPAHEPPSAGRCTVWVVTLTDDPSSGAVHWNTSGSTSVPVVDTSSPGRATRNVTDIDSAGVVALAANSSPNGSPPTAATRSASANDSNPFGSVSAPSIAFDVWSSTVVRAAAIARERRADAVEHVGELLRRRHGVRQRDLDAAGVGRRRAVDRPSGRDRVVEAQILDEPGDLADQLGVGDGVHRHGAGAVGGDDHVDLDVEPARRERERADHDEEHTAGHDTPLSQEVTRRDVHPRRRRVATGTIPALGGVGNRDRLSTR